MLLAICEHHIIILLEHDLRRAEEDEDIMPQEREVFPEPIPLLQHSEDVCIGHLPKLHEVHNVRLNGHDVVIQESKNEKS